MKVHVRYFAVLRERLGREEELLDLPAGSDVAAALATLSKRHEGMSTLLPFLQVAVNQSMSSWDRGLADGDELALIPPVAGGTGAERVARVVVDRSPSVDKVIDAVRGPGMGGLVTFIGLVRDHNDGRSVQRLEYEAYVPMTEKVFRELCDEIEREIEGTRLAVEHRTGTLAVGDVAVVIAAAAPHRGEAFRACQAMIDRLKERAPIWKKEIGPDGASWVGLGP
jgi:molybdopterin synthase catalytic subunit